MTAEKPLIEVRGLTKHYSARGKVIKPLQGVDLAIYPGKTLGIVGESGSGKSTLGKVLLRLEEPTFGEILFRNQIINALSQSEMHYLRQSMQMIFQDPYTSFNPRMTIEEILAEGQAIHKLAFENSKQDTLAKALKEVGLEENMLARYPHQLSGGQRQRIGIARAMLLNPCFLVLDEPLSALDVCTQSQIKALLLKLKQEKGLTYLFISHDLHAVRDLSDYVAVMYAGKIVEQTCKKDLFSTPLHPYTQALLSCVPYPDPKREKNRLRVILKGEMPSPCNTKPGCSFHPRCPHAMPICGKETPPLLQVGDSHFVACHKFTST